MNPQMLQTFNTRHSMPWVVWRKAAAVLLLGASALLVFPPAPFTLGQSPEMALAHFKRIADATDLPIIVFQYPLATGQGYPKETLLRLCAEVPTIRAIKDWIGNVAHHEWHVRTLQNLPRPVNVLSTHSAWLLSSLVLGCNGLLSGSGSVIADLQAQLFRAVRGDDLAAARALNERIEPLARVFYAEPWADMHNRMKEALVLLGRLPRAVVRPPLVRLGQAEIERIRGALVEAGAGRPFDNNSPAELGARTVEILEAAYRSAGSGVLERVKTLT